MISKIAVFIYAKSVPNTFSGKKGRRTRKMALFCKKKI